MDPEKLKTQDPIVKLKTSLIELKGEPHLGYLLSGITLPDNEKVLEHLLKMAREADKTKHTDPVWLKAQAKDLVDQTDKGVEETAAIEPTVDSIISHIVKQLPPEQRKAEREKLRKELMSWRYGDIKTQIKELVRRSSGWVFGAEDEQDWSDLVTAIEKLPGGIDIETRITQYKLVYEALDKLHQSAVNPTGGRFEQLKQQLEQLKQQLADIQGRFAPEVRGDAEFITTRYIPRINQILQAETEARKEKGSSGWSRLSAEEEETVNKGPEGWEEFFEDLMFMATANPTTQFHLSLTDEGKLDVFLERVIEYYRDRKREPYGKEIAKNYKSRKETRREIHDRAMSALYQSFDMKALTNVIGFQTPFSFDVMTKGEGIAEVDPGSDYVSLANQMYESAAIGVLSEKYMRYTSLRERRTNGESLTLEEETQLEGGVLLQDKDLMPNLVLSTQYTNLVEECKVWDKYLTNEEIKDTEKPILKKLQRRRDEQGLSDKAMSQTLQLTEEQKKMHKGRGMFSPVEVRVYDALEAYARQEIRKKYPGINDDDLKIKLGEEGYKIRRAIFFARAHNTLSLRTASINAKIGICPSDESGEEMLRSWGSQEHALRVFNWNKVMYYRYRYFDDPLKRAQILILYRDYFDDLARQLRINANPQWREDWQKLNKEVTKVAHDAEIDRERTTASIKKMEDFFRNITGIELTELIEGGFLIRIGGIYDGTGWRTKLAIIEGFREEFQKRNQNRPEAEKKSWKEFVLGLQYQQTEDIIKNEIDNFEFVDSSVSNMNLRSHLQVIAQMPQAEDVRAKVNELIAAIDAYQADKNAVTGKTVEDLWKEVSVLSFDPNGLNSMVKEQVIFERKRSILKLMAKRTPTVIAELFPQEIRLILEEEFGDLSDIQKQQLWRLTYQALMLSQGQITTKLVTGKNTEDYFVGDKFVDNLRDSDLDTKLISDQDGVVDQAKLAKVKGMVGKIRRLVDTLEERDHGQGKQKVDAFLRMPFQLTLSMVDVPYQMTDYQRLGGAAAIFRRIQEVSTAYGGYEALKEILNMPPDLKTLVEATKAYVDAISDYEGAGDDKLDPCGGGSLPRARRLAGMTIEIAQSGELTKLFPELEPLLVRLADPTNEWFKGIMEIAQNHVSIVVKHRGERGMNWEGPDINEYLQMLRSANVFLGNHELMKQLEHKYGATNYDNIMFQMRKLIVPVLMWAVITALTSELQRKGDEGEEH